ncbi:MAG: ATP-dependent helicase, partial [Actinomycetota bacterium]|nr:ATP-dependent helicase [Actinomycetota bacterium]
VPVVLDHAARLEEQRDHALDRRGLTDVASIWAEEEGMLAEAERPRDEAGVMPEQEQEFEALESDAHFDHVLFDSQQFGLHASIGSDEEQDYLGLPGLLEPDQVAILLREHQTRQTARNPGAAAPVAAHRALAAQRKELNTLVAAYARKKTAPHAMVHSDLRRVCGGPTLEAATSEQVAHRIQTIRSWLVGRR